MTDRDRTVGYSMNGANDRPAQPMALADFPVPQEQPADVVTGLVSLGYLWAAVKRSIAFLCTMVIVGVLIGFAVLVKEPPAYKAETSVLITYPAGSNPSMLEFDNQAIAESHTVAKLAMDKLGIHESLGTFAASYTVAIVTERVMRITASAPSASGAVSRASAIAAEFLAYSAQEEEAAQNETISAMELELTQSQQSVTSLSAQISNVESEQETPAQQAKLASLKNQESQAAELVGTLQQTISDTKTGSGTLAAIKGSVILDPAELTPYSKKKYIAYYAAYGLIGGLAIGLGVVILRTLVSNKLRRRDDIAWALGAPVRLSVGPVRPRRTFPPSRRVLKAVADPDIRRIAAHLRGAASAKDGHLALAVVPVDDSGVAALSLTALAISYAQDGRNVMLVDLANGRPVTALLGQKSPGVHAVRIQQASLTLAVPFPEELDPSAPGTRGPALAWQSKLGDQIGDAWGAVDVLLALGTLDPARGGDYLATWADHAVVVTTAGRPSWTRLRAAGEMIRLAGMSPVSAVLIGVDKSDESLGLLPSDPDSLFDIGRLS